MDKKLVNKKQTRVLWIDLEMTGLDPIQDRIMEVAAIVTDWDFKEIATYESVIKVGPRLVQKRMTKGPAAEFWNRFSAVRDALIDQNLKKGISGRVVENQLLEFIDKYFEKDTPVILAGNSIHMDRRFIINEWHRFDARLHYRMLDVSAWKIVFEGKYGKKFSKIEAHRAIEDIRGSIEELKYYIAKAKL